MNKLLLEAMATEFSRGCIEKCKTFFEKSRDDKFVKSSQLEDFLRLPEDFEAEAEAEVEDEVDIELFVLFKAEGLRKIDLSAWIKSEELGLTLEFAPSEPNSVTFR